MMSIGGVLIVVGVCLVLVIENFGRIFVAMQTTPKIRLAGAFKPVEPPPERKLYVADGVWMVMVDYVDRESRVRGIPFRHCKFEMLSGPGEGEFVWHSFAANHHVSRWMYMNRVEKLEEGLRLCGDLRVEEWHQSEGLVVRFQVVKRLRTGWFSPLV